MTDHNGLYHMRARYYNPQTRRFVNRDTYTGGIKDAQSLNRYAYVEGNPLLYADPSGHIPFFLIPLGAAAIGAIVGGGGRAIMNTATGNKWNDGIVSSAGKR